MARSWDSFRDIDALRREVSRIFDNLGDGGRWRFPFSQFSFLPGWATRAYPLINMGEDADSVYVEALAPGIDPAELNISVVGDQLTLAGEKKSIDEEVNPDAYHRGERAAGRFVRTLNLPAEVNPDAVTAQYRDGILRITMPKAETAKPRRIQVNVS